QVPRVRCALAVALSWRAVACSPAVVRGHLRPAVPSGTFVVVQGFGPALPSLSYLALRDARALSVASFFSPERLGYPPSKAQRARLLGRIDALVASSPEAAHAAEQRFPGEYHIVSEGVDAELFKPGRKRQLIVLEWRPIERQLARAVQRALGGLPDWELIYLRTKKLAGRPAVPAKLRRRAHVRTGLDGKSRAPILAEAAIFVPA